MKTKHLQDTFTPGIAQHFLLSLSLLLVMAGGSLSVASGQLPIHTIQGDGATSPFTNQFVVLDTSIITAKGNGLFFAQTPPGKEDGNIQTAEGLWIQYGQAASLETGMRIIATGTIAEDGNSNTVLIAESVELVSGRLAPVPISLDSMTDLADRSELVYEYFEGQLVWIDSAVLTQAYQPGSIFEINPLGKRTFREPGIAYPAFLPGIPQFDGNPERLLFEPGRFTATVDQPHLAGTRVQTLGVIVERRDGYAIWPLQFQFTPPAVPVALPVDDSGSFSIASMNLEIFDANGAFYALRLNKVARYIREIAGFPDVIALQEINSSRELKDLVNAIGPTSDGYPYKWYINTGNGNSSIHSAYLYKQCLMTPEITRLGVFESHSYGGALHDRPPLLMSIADPTNPEQTIRIINLHLRSLIGIEGTNSRFVRTKRHEQAISVARMINAFSEEDIIIVLGDFNAFPFTDGYVDVLAQISGKQSLGAVYPVEQIHQDSLRSPFLALPTEAQYSYIFEGNSQMLDHLLFRDRTNYFTGEQHFFLRGNADVPERFKSDPDASWRFSDHDGLLSQFKLPTAWPCDVTPDEDMGIVVKLPNPASGHDAAFIIISKSNDPVSWTLYNVFGQSLVHDSQSAIDKEWLIDVIPDLIPGTYFLEIKIGQERIVKKWIIH